VILKIKLSYHISFPCQFLCLLRYHLKDFGYYY
jgi:hypothetical protein